MSEGVSGTTEHAHVGFQVGDDNQRKHKRYLTAKYDRRTRKIYSEKTRIDEFILSELKRLYNTENDEYDCVLDSEMIANSDASERRPLITEKLINCAASQSDKDCFIVSLLEKVSELDQLTEAAKVQKPASSMR